MAFEPHIITATDLASAWLTAAEWTARTPNDARSLAVTVSVAEDESNFRNLAFESMLSETIRSINGASKKPKMVQFIDNASTIFPENLWRARKADGRTNFYDRYIAQLKRIKKLSPKNVYGVYFERMIAFQAMRTGKPPSINQLEFIIRLLNKPKTIRQSALQINIFHPAYDHTGQVMRGFPCLQQVSFTHPTKRVLHLNAYYPTQYIFERGYGNYLGLCHLGRFVAEATNQRFSSMTCFIGSPCNKLSNCVVRKHCDALRSTVETTAPINQEEPGT